MRCIIALVIIGVLATLCGSYVLHNKFWFLTVALAGIGGGSLVFLGAAGIFLHSRKVDAALSPNTVSIGNIGQAVPRITAQWDYRPKKPIRVASGLR